MKYFLMKPKAKKYECHLHCLQFDHTCIFYLFDRFLSRHWDNKMSDTEQEEYTKYILNLSDYEQESWDMFWKELNENLVSWG